MVFNFIGMVLTAMKQKSETDKVPDFGTDPFGNLFYGFNFGVWIIVVTNVSLGVTVSLVLKYFDNVAKCIGGVCIIFCCTGASWVFFGTEICPEFQLAVILFGM